MGSDERVKSRLFQVLIKNTRSDLNSRSTVQISNSLPLSYAPQKIKKSTMSLTQNFKCNHRVMVHKL